jgi:hypothetical protein
MGQIDLHEALAAAGPKRGEPSRNPLGRPRGSYSRNREIQSALKAEGDTPCEVPGFEHLTKHEYWIKKLWALAMAGERWASTQIMNRLYGRVPLTVEMEMELVALQERRQAELADLSDDELRARVAAVKALIDGGRDVIDMDAPR